MLNIDDRIDELLDKCANPDQCEWVLRKMAKMMNAKNQCWPSHAYIAEKTGYSVSKVKRLLGQMKDAGVLTWDRRTNPNNKSNYSNMYTITEYIKKYNKKEDHPPSNGDLPPSSQVNYPPSTYELPPSSQVTEEVLISEVLNKEEDKAPAQEYKDPIVADHIRSVKMAWNQSLQSKFEEYCFYMNQKKRGNWGKRPKQVKDTATLIKNQLEKFGESVLIGHLDDLMLLGNTTINCQWYLNKLDKKEVEPPELTLPEYYRNYLRPVVIQNSARQLKAYEKAYNEKKSQMSQIRDSLGVKNITCTAPFVFDVLYGMFSSTAGSRPEMREKRLRAFIASLNDYDRNQGDLRKLFSKYLKQA